MKTVKYFLFLFEAMYFSHSTFPPLPSQLHVTLHHDVCAAMRSRTRDALLKVGYIRGCTLKNEFFAQSSYSCQ